MSDTCLAVAQGQYDFVGFGIFWTRLSQVIPFESGDSYIILKDVRLRCTLSPQDSANLPARRQGAAQAPLSVDF